MWRILCAILSFMVNVNGISIGDCYLRGINETHWLTRYKNDPVDDFESEQFQIFWIKNVTTVEIQGDDYGKYFGVKIEYQRLIIFPTPAFKYFEIYEKNTEEPEMYVRLKFQCNIGSRQLSFYQPIRDHNTYSPEFEKSLYTYILPMPLPGKFDVSSYGEQIIACDLDISNMRLDFTVSPAEDFFLTWNGPINDTNKCHKAVLKTVSPLRLLFNKVYEIIVTDTKAPLRSNVAKLEIKINENASIPSNPYFEYAYYTAAYNKADDGNSTLIIDNPIRLENGCSKIQLQLIEFKHNFRVGCETNQVSLELIEDFPDSCLATLTYILVTIEATLKHAEGPGRTVVVIKLPQKECFKPTTPTRYNSEALYSAPIIRFTQDNYWFEVEYNYKGIIGVVEAVAVPEENLKYSIFPEGSFLEINKNTGFLNVTEKCNVGAYHFNVYAKGVQSKLTAQANVIINVVRNDGNQIAKHSLLVERVRENEERYIKLPCQCNFCAYVIIEQYPETNPKLFRIHNQMHMYAVPINREMNAIVNMKVPQFSLQLILTAVTRCSNKHSSTSLQQNMVDIKDVHREWAFVPSKIYNKPNQLLMSVIVEDVNDNPPVFQEGSKLVVGYPVKDLVDYVIPPYLAKVVATDLDEGINAEIRYSTESLHFIVHSKTGVIYPRENGFDDEFCLRFNVTATDKDGAVDGLSTNLIIEVKPLKPNHLIILTVKNILLENINDALDKLSDQTNLTIKCLTAAVIPITDEDDSSSEESSYTNISPLTFSRIVLYGLNNENELTENTKLQKKLENTNIFEDFTVQTFERTTLKDCEDEKTFNKTNFIVAISILSVFLVLLTIAFVVLYVFTISRLKKSQPLPPVKEVIDKPEKIQKISKKFEEKLETVSSLSSNQESMHKEIKNELSDEITKFQEKDETIEEDSQQKVKQREFVDIASEYKSSGRKFSRKTVHDIFVVENRENRNYD